MIIKEHDRRKSEVDTLTALTGDKSLTDEQRSIAEKHLEALKAHIEERGAAANRVSRLIGHRPDLAVIHDLDVSHYGDTVHIDHLVVNANFRIYVIDAQYLENGLMLNWEGEWVTLDASDTARLTDPKHGAEHAMQVFSRALIAHTDEWPKKFGQTIEPIFGFRILLSDDEPGATRIMREQKSLPASSFPISLHDLKKESWQLSFPFITLAKDLPGVVKPSSGLKTLLRRIGRAKVKGFADKIAAMHSLAQTDWKRLVIGEPDVSEANYVSGDHLENDYSSGASPSDDQLVNPDEPYVGDMTEGLIGDPVDPVSAVGDSSSPKDRPASGEEVTEKLDDEASPAGEVIGEKSDPYAERNATKDQKGASSNQASGAEKKSSNTRSNSRRRNNRKRSSSQKKGQSQGQGQGQSQGQSQGQGQAQSKQTASGSSSKSKKPTSSSNPASPKAGSGNSSKSKAGGPGKKPGADTQGKKGEQ